MLRTIMIGTCVFVQGMFAGAMPNGLIRVRVGDKIFTGRPVTRATPTCATPTTPNLVA